MGRVAGKVALITGGARGIGAEAARFLVAEGANVVITDILDAEGETLATELGAAAVRALGPHHRINLTGVFTGIKTAVPALRESAKNASIINISSTAGMKGYPALIRLRRLQVGRTRLTKSVAIDLGPANIRVNSIHPGMIATPMTEGIPQPQTHVAMKRSGTTPEIANLIVYLASDESTFCTGADVVADGGEVAGLATM